MFGDMTATETIAIMATDPYTRVVALETMLFGRSDIAGIGSIAGIIGIGEGTGMAEIGSTAEILSSGFLLDVNRTYRLKK
jgi:hypothetical protein